MPDPTQFPTRDPRPWPYIFSEAEIVRLLTTAEALPPRKGSPLHREVARVGIIILHTTGLRRGELVRLTLSDYEQAEQVFHVRRAKFDKSRLVPLSADATREIDRYLAARRQAGAPCGGDAPLLVHNHGARFRGYTGEAFGGLLRKVIRATDIRTSRGRAPRVHDLRFTFAVHALLRWYRTGVDVNARLPALATYLGHVSVVSTQYYLTFLQATAEAASGSGSTPTQQLGYPPVLRKEVVDDAAHPLKFATALRAFFAQHLPLTREAESANCPEFYRDTFVLLLRFLAVRHGCGVVDLELQHLRVGDVLAFLEHLETERKNSVATRNARLAAIHAFARFLATRDPEPVEECQRLLAVPT